MVDGTVKDMDKAAGKVSIAHAPINDFELPGMTMKFQVEDSAWLDQMKPGDNIRFKAGRVDGAFTVVQYEPGK